MVKIVPKNFWKNFSSHNLATLPDKNDHEDRENRSKSRCFCQTRGRDFLAAHTWQSALAARFYGNEAQEGSSGPFRTLKEFARLRRGSAARFYGKIGDLCDKAQLHRHIARDLYHPLLVGMWRHPSD